MEYSALSNLHISALHTLLLARATPTSAHQRNTQTPQPHVARGFLAFRISNFGLGFPVEATRARARNHPSTHTQTSTRPHALSHLKGMAEVAPFGFATAVVDGICVCG